MKNKILFFCVVFSFVFLEWKHADGQICTSLTGTPYVLYCTFCGSETGASSSSVDALVTHRFPLRNMGHTPSCFSAPTSFPCTPTNFYMDINTTATTYSGPCSSLTGVPYIASFSTTPFTLAGTGSCAFANVSMSFREPGTYTIHYDMHYPSYPTGVLIPPFGGGLSNTVTVAGPVPGWGTTPPSQAVSSAGGSFSATVYNRDGCGNYLPQFPDSWIHFVSYGVAPGVFNYSVDANSGAARMGHIYIKDVYYGISGVCTLTVNQSGTIACTTPSDPPNPIISSSSCGSVTLSEFSSPPGGVIWYWQGTSCGFSTGATSASSYTAVSNGTYRIRAFNTAGSGCWSLGCGSTSVTMPSAPAFTRSHTNATCFGCSNGSLFISASGGSPPYQYSLNGGGWSSFFSSSTTISGLSAGTYSIQVKDATGCMSGTISETILQPPHINSITLSNHNIIAGNSISFSASVSGGPTTYTWTFSGGTPPSTITTTVSTPTVTFNNPNTGGYYTVSLQTFNSAGASNIVTDHFTVQPNTYACIPAGNYVIQQGYPSGHVAEPINLATGSYEYKHTDINIPAGNTPLTFTRYYSTVNDTVDGPLSVGWSHTYNFYIRNYSDTLWTVHYGDGHTSRFIPLVSGLGTSFPLYAGTYETLYRNPSTNQYTLTFKDGNIYLFDTNGKLLSITDLNGNSTTLAYSGSDLVSVRAPGGRALTFTNLGGKIISISDTLGRTVVYSYSGGNLVFTTDQNLHTTAFSYDGVHNITVIRTARGDTLLQNSYDGQNRVVDQSDALHQTTHIAYDSPSVHQATVIYPGGATSAVRHDTFFRLVYELDELGNSKAYSYDYNNNLDSATDENAHVSIYSYDAVGNLLSANLPMSVTAQFAYNALNKPKLFIDPLSQRDSLIYNSQGNITDIYRSDGASRHFDYFTNGLLKSSTDWLNHSTRYHYNTLDDLDSIVAPNGNRLFSYDLTGRLLSKTDENGHTINYRYDSLCNLRIKQGPLADSIQYSYDANNNLTSVIDRNGNVTLLTYDSKDRLTLIHDALGGNTHIGYDQRDNVDTVVDANSHSILYGHDAKNRLTSITNSLGISRLGYDPVGNVTSDTDAVGRTHRHTYDFLNRYTVLQDGLTHTTSLAYDPSSRITAMTDPLTRNTAYGYTSTGQVNQITDANTKNTNVTYDANGMKLSIRDANTHLQSFRYDAASRCVGYTDGDMHVDSLVYDSVGNVVKEIKPTGTITKIYDAANNLTNVINSTGNNYTYGYDRNRNIVSATNNIGTSSFAVDSMNRLKRYIDPFSDTVQYVRDPVGNITSMIYPGGHTLRYFYNGANLLDSVSDWLGHTFRYQYDANGKPTRLQYPNGIECRYSYDVAGRLDTQTTSLGTTTIAQSIYLLNAKGERTQEIRHGPSVKHLQAENYANTYADDDHILTSLSKTYSFDGAGNRTVETSPSGVTNYYYSVDNYLDSFSSSAGTTVFHYDALGTRLERTQGITTKRYVIDYGHDLPQVLQERTSFATVQNTYIYGIGLLAMIDSVGIIHYYHFDPQHNTVAMSNDSGHVSDTYTYIPSGKVLKHIGNSQQPYTFLGEYGVQQETLPLYYLRARYYDASQNGIFLNKDPYPPSLANPQTLNRYAYGLNNPISMFDPSGMCTEGNTSGGINTSNNINGGMCIDQNSSLRMCVDPNTYQYRNVSSVYYGNNLLLETYLHYQFGGGKDLYVSASVLDFSNVTQSDLDVHKDGTYGLDLYKIDPTSQAALALGKITLKKLNNNEFSIEKDTYDFNIEWQNVFSKRNAATVADGFLHNFLLPPIIPIVFGGSFNIYFVGTINIK